MKTSPCISLSNGLSLIGVGNSSSFGVIIKPTIAYLDLLTLICLRLISVHISKGGN